MSPDPADNRPSAALQRQSRLSLYLALAYLLLIAYASLNPFSRWRMPPDDLLGFVHLQRPRYITRGDIIINLLAYLPLGLLLAVALARVGRAGAVALATGAGLAVSLAMETLQQMVPGRIASNLDLLHNALGTLAGALLALVFLRAAAAGSSDLWRGPWLQPGRLVDLGLVLAVLWLIGQANPSLPLMGTRVFESAVPLERLYQAHTFSLVQAGLSLANTLLFGVLISLLLLPLRSPFTVSTAAVAGIALGKLLAGVVLLKSEALLQWLGPEAAIGTAYGIAFLGLIAPTPRTARVAVGLAAAAASLVLAYAFEGPANTSAVMRLFSWRYGHLLNFNGLTRLLAELWPMLAIVYFATARDVKREA